jgi:methionyl aminopeptidase
MLLVARKKTESRKAMANKTDAMREGGKILGRILMELRDYVQVGLNEMDINKWAEGKILEYGAEVAYYEEQPNFPGAICISVNDELIHGVPEDNVLEDGDKVSFDLSIKYKGYYVDSAFTMIVGKGNAALKHLLSFTESALLEGIEQVRTGVKTGDIGAVVEATLEKGKLGVIRNYVGHGIGEKIHMPPDVPNFGKRGQGRELVTGDTICIEPMASLGKADTVIGEDGWTVLLKDGSIGAHFEHTILVTEEGCEILTRI